MQQKEQCPRYGMRKLSVGFVSCLLGFTLIVGFLPGTSYAASGMKTSNAPAANRNGTVVEYRLTSHHGKHDKVDAKSSATSNEDVQRKSVKYNSEKERIEWKSLKDEIRDIDGLWINGNQYTKGRKKDKLDRRQYYYKKGKVYINPGLRRDDVVNLKIKGKDNGFKYDGRYLNAIKDKYLFPLKKPGQIKVGDPDALTEAEKQEIIRRVKQLNPHAEKFEYNGKYLILYYPDDSRWGIPLDTILVKDESKASEKELVKAKEEAKATVDQLDELSKDEKTDAKTSIDQAADKEAIDKIVNGVTKTNNERAQAKKELVKAKEEAKATVGKLDSLDDTAKEEINKKINGAKDTATVDKIVEDAKAANVEAKAAEEKRILDAKKEEAKEEVDKLPNLSEDTKNGIKEKIDEAGDVGAVNKIVEEAKKENTEAKVADQKFAARVKKAKDEARVFMGSMDKSVLDSQSIHYLADDVKDKINAAIARSNDLLADEAIDQAKLNELENIPSKNIDGKKTGIFRAFTKQALVDYEVLGTRDQLNPQNKKSYVALKDNKIKIRSNLVGAGKIGENEKAFFKLNYVTEADYASHDTPAKPMAVSFRSAQVDAASTATPKYKKQEVPRENYEVKAVDGGYEITIKQLPENVKYIKPIVYVKFADQTYFENGDMVAVTATENTGTTPDPVTPGEQPNPGEKPNPGEQPNPGEKPNPGEQPNPGEKPNPGEQPNPGEKPNPATPGGKMPGTPSTPVIPNNNRGGGRGSSSHSIWMTTGQSSQEKKPEPVLQAEAPKVKHQAFIFGYGDNSFRPEGKISRAEAASMIAALAGLDTSNKAKPGFKDTDSSWYNEVINAMVKNDLMLADKNGNFRPNEPITRAEFARALAGIDKKTDRIAPFADVKGHPFEAAINQAFGNGRIIGYPDGTFKPDGAITRAEAVTILNRYDGRNMSKQDLMKIRGNFNSFKDVSENHWAYVQILMAANNYQAMLDALAAHK